MSERLKNRYYIHKKLFIADMTRIFTNCRAYNKPDTEYYRCANTMERFFKNKLKEFNLQDPQPPTPAATWTHLRCFGPKVIPAKALVGSVEQVSHY